MARTNAAGGWDAFNVTEDADLGIRLSRLGYHCGAISLPTWEEAPVRFKSWLPQRTRWIKGWVLTLLVHMRHPRATRHDFGWRNYFMFHMVLTSIVVSVLVHPLYLVAFIYEAYKFSSVAYIDILDRLFLGLSTFNLVAGYLTYGFLAWAVLSVGQFKTYRSWLLLLPVYWILISYAGWRALFQLVRKPHIWEKTPHGEPGRNTPKNPN